VPEATSTALVQLLQPHTASLSHREFKMSV
jgi:hypothetical protein